MADAHLDFDRARRQGLPEVVFAEGKTPEQVRELLGRLHDEHGSALATRVRPEHEAAVRERHENVRYFPRARVLQLGPALRGAHCSPARVAVVSAGTSDLPVAEECSAVLEWAGHRVVPVTDVGVAGLHRILGARAELESAAVVVVMAGMDGALPSVVGGLVAAPVVAVPTSVGYGVGVGGVAALMTMLNSCAAGVTVVNIDNGFGAAVAAHRILIGRDTPLAELGRGQVHVLEGQA